MSMNAMFGALDGAEQTTERVQGDDVTTPLLNEEVLHSSKLILAHVINGTPQVHSTAEVIAAAAILLTHELHTVAWWAEELGKVHLDA